MHCFDYYRNNLSERERYFYDQIKSQYSHMAINGECILTGNIKTDEKNSIYNAYLSLKDTDVQAFYYRGNPTISISNGTAILKNSNPLPVNDVLKYKDKLTSMVEEYTKGVSGLPYIDKLRIIYDRITSRLRFERSEYSQELTSIIKGSSGVCNSIAALTVLCFRVVGIDAVKVVGIGKKEAHSWVMIWNENGERRFFDPTWDLNRAPRYKYFNLTEKEMNKNHTSYRGGIAELRLRENQK